MSMAEDNDNLLHDFGSYRDKIPALKRLNVEVNDIDLASKSSDTKFHARDMLLRHISQDERFESELSSFLREIRFSD